MGVRMGNFPELEALQHVSPEFEAWWQGSKVHEAVVTGQMTGILELAFKEVAWAAWQARELSIIK